MPFRDYERAIHVLFPGFTGARRLLEYQVAAFGPRPLQPRMYPRQRGIDLYDDATMAGLGSSARTESSRSMSLACQIDESFKMMR